MAMGRAEWGRLTSAWPGEAADFTPELARHLELLDRDLGLGLSQPDTEVPAAGGRRIDILASGIDGSHYVIENQYGRADHDHLTRGLAYAVSAEAAGLIVVAEEHRDEFREVAHYLNDLAARAGKGIKVWLVEAKAIRVDDSAWAPVFEVVAEPSKFVQEVAGRVAGYERRVGLDEVLSAFPGERRAAAVALVDAWKARNLPVPAAIIRGGTPLLSFGARGPSSSGWRTVFTAFADGRIYVSFSAFSGKNSGYPIPVLASDDFIEAVSKRLALTKGYSAVDWLTPERVPLLLDFADTVVSAYQAALPEILSE
ncbi:hypothetical protein [Protaetiibacter intestinalis]|uniref:DUF4268 domain-containing protein n=1 Tax=Protaetiibacter intestinalis TaxID=2419774 RepID=A0A387B9C8_9MICO|nr:hypothetical protein [Protaetiibacter intestinalis]AYF98987.1 hypothetical protein D7I47_12480 [Protaetiibacter intestinalis]